MSFNSDSELDSDLRQFVLGDEGSKSIVQVKNVVKVLVNGPKTSLFTKTFSFSNDTCIGKVKPCAVDLDYNNCSKVAYEIFCQYVNLKNILTPSG